MIGGERGAILVVALVTLAILSVLGSAALRVASDEQTRVRQAERTLLAEQLADAGLERVLAWFAEPEAYPGPPGAPFAGPCAAPVDATDWMRKRCVGRDGVPGFRTVAGQAQFVGSVDVPDLVYTWPAPLDTWVDTPAERGVPANRVLVRLSAPSSPDGIATVWSQAWVGAETVALRAELIEGPWSGLVGAIYAGEAGPGPFPARVHWGDVFVSGPLDLRPVWDLLPRHDADASVSGLPYLAFPPADRWFGLTASGTVLGAAGISDGQFDDPYRHVLQNRAIPRLGVWSYEALKGYAKRHGRYFTTRGTGLLYADDREPGVTPPAAFASASGNHRELLFVDTLDQRAPRADNLERLHLRLNGVDVDAFVGADIVLSGGEGRALTIDSPPAEGTLLGAPTLRGLVLSPVHYAGALIVAGEVETENRVNVFGAVAAARGFRDLGGLEIWYDGRLAQGYRKGFAPVLVRPGSRRRVVPETPPAG